MPVERTRGLPTPTVAHEGNPRSTSLVVSGTLDGEAFIHFLPPDVITAIPAPSEPPPGGGNSNCPGCVGTLAVNADPVTEALCASDTGDGCVVTCPGDYSFDPVFYTAACANYYSGTFTFGLNSGFDAGPADIPSYWVNTNTFIPATGMLTLNSACASRVTRRLIADVRLSVFGSSVVAQNVTPATYQAAIDDWNTTGAHGQRCIATPDGTPNVDVTCGGVFDCRFIFTTSGAAYGSRVSGVYMSELNNPISGIAMLTDDGSGTRITGYGCLVNSFNNTLEAVQWSDSLAENYTVLASIPYIPTQGDYFEINLEQKCPCPYGPTDGSSIHPAYPKGGFFQVLYTPTGQGSASVLYAGSEPVYADQVGSLTPAAWADLLYGGLLAIQVSNGKCDNLAIWRNVYVRFSASMTTC